MKRIACCLVLAFFICSAFSQKVYFIYLQTESEQPFYVKLNDKMHSSAGSGYLVLPKLVDSTYELNIGFPQNKWPEQKFSIKVNAKDHGYLLKSFEDKSWGLFDLQTLAIQMASTGKTNTPVTEPRQVSTFTDVLSKAANDPSLKEKPVAVKQEEKPAVIPPVVVKEETKKDNVVVNPVVVNNPPVIKKEEPPVVKQEVIEKKEDPKPIEPIAVEYKKSVVTKKSESSTTEGLGLTFVDEYPDGKKDTIRIVIPPSRVSATETKEDQKFLNIDSKPVSETTARVIDKNDCSSSATESDFLKLRKKMAGETTSENMTAEAQKIFKSKCFTVAQIKNLGALYLEDGGKYKFFDAAYSHVSDIENFSSLLPELKDDYYINRFKAMLK
ncbi:MAG: DUF4476 domain-containing protein [Chitinophagaceae bacterium]